MPHDRPWPMSCSDDQADFWHPIGQFQVSDPAGVGGSLYFMKVPEPKVGTSRLHLDLVTSGSTEDEVMRRRSEAKIRPAPVSRLVAAP
jgi:hypothetical protein